MELTRETRVDPLTGQCTVFVKQRLSPVIDPSPGAHQRPESCPFCPGHEGATPSELGRVGGEQWTARVFPNQVPIVRIEESSMGHALGPYDTLGAFGAHEVFVEGREHTQDDRETRLISARGTFDLLRDRMADLVNDPRFEQLSWYRNVGWRAGARQSHPHSQLLALGFVSPDLVNQRERVNSYARLRGRALLADIAAEELADGSRLLLEGEAMIAVCPWASQVPGEVWLIPKEGGAHFFESSRQEREELSVFSTDLIERIALRLGFDHYIASIVTAPLRGGLDGFRWYLRLRPQVQQRSGALDGAGLHLNGLFPEEAARILRPPS